MDWMDDAECADHPTVPPDAWFIGKRTSDPQGLRKQAEAICAGCPVREECYDHAVSIKARFGIWGGVHMNTHRKNRP